MISSPQSWANGDPWRFDIVAVLLSTTDVDVFIIISLPASNPKKIEKNKDQPGL